MYGSYVAFDPSTKKQYKKGRGMLGDDAVRGGNWFEIKDHSKLKEYVRYQKEHENIN